jgi:hypothetical protein
MTKEKMTMYQLEKNLIDDLDFNKKEILEHEHPEDLITEYADGWVPVYNINLLDCLSTDYALAQVDEPGLLPESPSVYDIIRIAIYEKLTNVAHAWLYENQKKQEVA